MRFAISVCLIGINFAAGDFAFAQNCRFLLDNCEPQTRPHERPSTGPSVPREHSTPQGPKVNLAQFSRHEGCYKYKSAAECGAMRRVMRNAIAVGTHTAQDYAGATYCGCGP
jgi:hypothetical protein